jgi:hypothetical protein
MLSYIAVRPSAAPDPGQGFTPPLSDNSLHKIKTLSTCECVRYGDTLGTCWKIGGAGLQHIYMIEAPFNRRDRGHTTSPLLLQTHFSYTSALYFSPFRSVAILIPQHYNNQPTHIVFGKFRRQRPWGRSCPPARCSAIRRALFLSRKTIPYTKNSNIRSVNIEARWQPFSKSEWVVDSSQLALILPTVISRTMAVGLLTLRPGVCDSTGSSA